MKGSLSKFHWYGHWKFHFKMIFLHQLSAVSQLAQCHLRGNSPFIILTFILTGLFPFLIGVESNKDFDFLRWWKVVSSTASGSPLGLEFSRFPAMLSLLKTLLFASPDWTAAALPRRAALCRPYCEEQSEASLSGEPVSGKNPRTEAVYNQTLPSFPLPPLQIETNVFPEGSLPSAVFEILIISSILSCPAAELRYSTAALMRRGKALDERCGLSLLVKSPSISAELPCRR